MKDLFFGYEQFIDRRGLWREDEAALAPLWQGVQTYYLPSWHNLQLLLQASETLRHVALLPAEEYPELWEQALTPIFLGTYEDRCFVALEMPEDWSGKEALEAKSGATFTDLRKVRQSVLVPWEFDLLTLAKALSFWHSKNHFCGNCGSPTKPFKAGFARQCTNPRCGMQHFPRTDGAIIVCVEWEDKLLLARQSRWPAHRYSIVAGFVDPGESLEHTVMREVWEETNIRVTDIRYIASQSWPYPASLMLGFSARALNSDIQLLDGELEIADWFAREDIVSGLQTGTLGLPPFTSISYKLIINWYNQGAAVPLQEQFPELKAPSF